MQMTRIVLPGMKQRKRGAIVNIGSAAATVAPSGPLYAVYAGTKVSFSFQRAPEGTFCTVYPSSTDHFLQVGRLQQHRSTMTLLLFSIVAGLSVFCSKMDVQDSRRYHMQH